MTKRSTAGLAAAAMLFGSLACAGGMAREDDTAAAAQQDTTDVAAQQDTTEATTPPGYSGMEQDTTMATDSAPTAVDTFLNEQGTGVPADTAGYGGFEQPDTSGAATQDTGTGMDTTGTGMDTGTGTDTSGTSGWADTTGTTGMDTTGTSGWSDTTGQSSWDTTGQQ